MIALGSGGEVRICFKTGSYGIEDQTPQKLTTYQSILGDKGNLCQKISSQTIVSHCPFYSGTKQHTFSRDCTLEVEFEALPRLVLCLPASLMRLDGGHKPQLPSAMWSLG